MDKLFVRPTQHLVDFFQFAHRFEDVLNLKTLPSWTLKKTLSYYNKYDEQNFLAYRFNVLREWYLNTPKPVPFFHKELRHYIDVLNLKNYLNAYEKNFILEAQSKQFTLDRNLKSLVIDFNVEKDETAYFHYRKFSIINYDHQTIEDIDFYLTNTRIVITYANHLVSFYLNKICELKFKDDFFSFDYYGHKYVFKCDRPQIILMSFKRISALTNEAFTNE